MIKKVFYASFSHLDYSVNAVYLNGLEQNGVTIHKLWLNKRKRGEYARMLKEYWRNRRGLDLIMIGYDSPQLVILARLISRKKIVYNALCSAYERFIVSRAVAGRFSLKSFYYWLAHFFAV